MTTLEQARITRLGKSAKLQGTIHDKRHSGYALVTTHDRANLLRAEAYAIDHEAFTPSLAGSQRQYVPCNIHPDGAIFVRISPDAEVYLDTPASAFSLTDKETYHGGDEDPNTDVD